MHTKKFKSVNSLAIRIPKQLANFFEGNNFKILKKNDQIIIEPEKNNWETIFKKCYNPEFPDIREMHFSDREEL